MKKTFLLLGCVGMLSMVSCSQDKPAETTTTTTDTTVMTDTNVDDAAYRSQADATAQRVATDLSVTDTAVVSKTSDVYYDRAKKLADVRNQYTTDTTGLYAAKRAAYLDSDTELKDVLTPAQYLAYTNSRTKYYEEGDVVATPTPVPASTSAPASTPNSRIERAAAGLAPGTSIKGADGSKISKSKDGDIKIKDANGNKAKKDGDDGTIKLKPVDGDKVKIK